MKKTVVLAFVCIVLFLLLIPARLRLPAGTHSEFTQQTPTEKASVEFKDKSQVSGSGVIINILADDNEGDRHQRFILRLPSGNTLLIAHNIDRAPRIQTIREGDVVEFFGVYEWNDRGGVVHWTHHDPAGRHQGGWLKHDGHIYQ